MFFMIAIINYEHWGRQASPLLREAVTIVWERFSSKYLQKKANISFLYSSIVIVKLLPKKKFSNALFSCWIVFKILVFWLLQPFFKGSLTWSPNLNFKNCCALKINLLKMCRSRFLEIDLSKFLKFRPCTCVITV